MANILLGLSSCHEAFLTAPVVRELLAAGHEVRLAWFGSEASLTDARKMGMPAAAEAVVAGDSGPSALASAAQFAAQIHDPASGDIVLTIGAGPFAGALARQATETAHGRSIAIALDAGVRPAQTHLPSTSKPSPSNSRLAVEHAANYCCVANEQARDTLVREGKPEHSIAITGSLTAAALRAMPAAKRPRKPFVWVALERDYGTRTIPGDLSGLFEGLRGAGKATKLAVRLAPTEHLDTCMLYDEPQRADWITASDRDPHAQLEAARTASLIITDSLGYQELAAAADLPCVALDLMSSWRPDLVRSGQVVVAAATAEIAGCATAAMRAAQASVRATGATRRNAEQEVVQAIQRFEQQRDQGEFATMRASQGDNLPSDGDRSGRTFDVAELDAVTDVLRSGTLNSTRGTYVNRFERDFAAWLGKKHAIACSNGSAAVHCAIAALGLSAGDEVITTPITDMGALTPIFYEGAVPVFADVDPDTLNVTADTIAAQLTDRTKAIIVTHLFGKTCELGPILKLACKHELPVIEDTAQAFGATLDGHKAGTQGLISAFSLQQGKHITTGEGGIVCTDDDEIARRLFLFVNKAWGYGDAKPDHYFPALNYRMTELQGAVAQAQLPKLDGIVAARRRIADSLRAALGKLTGLHYPGDSENSTHSYWKFAFRVDASVVDGGAVALGGRMREQGIACAPRYVQKPAFECALFREWQKSPVSALPLSANARGMVDGPLFDRSDYPGATAGLEQVVVLPINENYQDVHVTAIADAIRSAHQELTRG